MGHPILKWFKYAHLAPTLRETSAPFGELAKQLDDHLQDGPEKSVALRKLLEAKDAAVRQRIQDLEQSTPAIPADSTGMRDSHT